MTRRGPLLLVGVVVVLALFGVWYGEYVAHSRKFAGGTYIQILGSSPYVGRSASNFTLSDVRTGEPISLIDSSSAKPTVVFFGSFGCDLFCQQVDDIQRLYWKYRESARFVFVCVRDAGHPNPNLDEFLRTRPGQDQSSRIRNALDYYAIEMPCVIDGDDRRIEGMYSAYPERLLIIDSEGIVYWDSTPGISAAGLHLDEGETQLRECLSSQ